jgi:hypothetical protein
VSVLAAEKVTGTPNRAVPVFVPSGSVAVSCRVAVGIWNAAPVPPPGDGSCAWIDKLAPEPAGALIWATTDVGDWYVVGDATPLTRITVPGTNPVPVRVIAAVAPANAWGLAALTTGTGLTRVNVYEVVSAATLVK